jgi:drug/metabolite transporter (DMT)-like permease
VAALVLIPIAWHRGVLKPALTHKGAIISFAVVEMAIPFLLIAIGEKWLSSSLTGILVATVPMTVVIIAPLMGVREKLGWRRLAGLAIGFGGVVALLGLDSGHGAMLWLGLLCIVGAVIGYAVGPLIVQRYLADVDELGAVAGSLVVASLLLLPVAALSLPSQLPSFGASSSVLVLGLACTALAMILYFYLINEAGAARASLVAYVNPAVAALLGALVLNEPFGVNSGIGLAMILFGSWLATYKPQPKKATATPARSMDEAQASSPTDN